MNKHCGCFSHKHDHSVTSDKAAHIIKLLQDNFISPYKILYMLDPTQADHFKTRNQSNGCCSSNHITITDDQLSKTEKLLKELISQPNLAKNLNQIFQACAQKHKNIIQNGKNDKLEVNDQVDKFILDKVISEYTNHLIFTQLTQIITSQSKNRGKQIGLWATPATWKQKYPNNELNFLPPQGISQLVYRGFSVIRSFISNTENITRQTQILQKDGKFEERPWISVQSQEKVSLKTLSTPEKYSQIKNGQSEYFFPKLREALITISSIPFELNSKANLFCTVNSSSHLCHSNRSFISQKCKDSTRFTVILVICGKIELKINQQLVNLKNGDLFLIDNQRYEYSLKNINDQLFVCRCFIQTASKN